MPSKNYNGNNPLGRARIKSNGLDTNGALARVETQIGRLQPALSLQTGSLQLPNGRVQVPRRARRGGGGTAAAGCIPWKPTVVDTSETEVPNYKLRLSPGTINGVINPAWNDLVTLGNPAEGDLNYIIATVTFTSKQVSSIAYSIASAIPSGNDLSPTIEESFPTSLKIILGTLFGTSPCMVWNTNLRANAVEVFRATVESPAVGAKPYVSWYGISITNV